MYVKRCKVMFIRFPDRKCPPSSLEQVIMFVNIASKVGSISLVCTMHLHSSSSVVPAICGSSDVEDRFCNSSECVIG